MHLKYELFTVYSDRHLDSPRVRQTSCGSDNKIDKLLSWQLKIWWELENSSSNDRNRSGSNWARAKSQIFLVLYAKYYATFLLSVQWSLETIRNSICMTLEGFERATRTPEIRGINGWRWIYVSILLTAAVILDFRFCLQSDMNLITFPSLGNISPPSNSKVTSICIF